MLQTGENHRATNTDILRSTSFRLPTPIPFLNLLTLFLLPSAPSLPSFSKTYVQPDYNSQSSIFRVVDLRHLDIIRLIHTFIYTQDQSKLSQCMHHLPIPIFPNLHHLDITSARDSSTPNNTALFFILLFERKRRIKMEIVFMGSLSRHPETSGL